MYLWLSAIFWDYIDPGKLIPGILFIGVALLWSPWRRVGRAIATFGAVIFLLISILPLSGFFMFILENRFPQPITLPDSVDGIILLGGSADISISNSRNLPTANGNANRFLRFAELSSRYPAARLLFTGSGRRDKNSDLSSEIEISLEILHNIGIDMSRMEIESRATNTYENAKFGKLLVQPKKEEVWLLVTSAWHTPRAVGSFRQVGWEVMPVPSGYTSADSLNGWSFSFSPLQGLQSLSVATHEWIGLVVYWMLGRTGEIFPSP